MTTTLLAVDDSKTMRKVFEITFAGEPEYRMVLAANPDEAFAALGESPAVALVDAQLDGSSGYDLCQQLKQRAPGLKVLVLSSRQLPYDAARGGQAGADEHLDKPFDTQQLIDKVGALLKAKAAHPAGQHPAAQQPMAPAPVAAPAPTMSRAATPGVGPIPGQDRPRSQTLAYGPTGVGPAAGPPRPGVPGAAPAPVPGVRPAAPAMPVRPAAAAPAMPARPAAVAPAAAQRPAAASSLSRGVTTTLSGGASTPAAPVAPAPAVPMASPTLAAVPAQVPPAAPVSTSGVAATGGAVQVPAGLADKLRGLQLTEPQVQAVLALSREVIEQAVWEVVPTLAETIIREELARLTAE